MAINSGIEWTDGSAAVVTGCDYDGPGCKNCYAPKDAWRAMHSPNPKVAKRYEGTVEKRADGRLVWTGRVNVNEDLLLPLLARRKPMRWFLSHMGDVFHPAVPDAMLDRIMAAAALAPQHQVILLTKRPERLEVYYAADPWNDLGGPRAYAVMDHIQALARDAGMSQADVDAAVARSFQPLPNVILGASVANERDAADSVLGLSFLAGQGWNTAVSYEPALGPVDWAAYGYEFLSWLVSGGESGAHARPTHPDWHRAALHFCLSNGIPYFFKQWGMWKPFYDRDHDDPDWRAVPKEVPGEVCRLNLSGGQGFHGDRVIYFRRVRHKRDASNLLDGRTWHQLPAMPNDIRAPLKRAAA